MQSSYSILTTGIPASSGFRRRSGHTSQEVSGVICRQRAVLIGRRAETIVQTKPDGTYGAAVEARPVKFE